MNELLLKDILILNDDEKKNAKIALNMSWNGESYFDRWDKSSADNRDVSYSYASHYGTKLRNFTRIGQIVFGFVQLPTIIKDGFLLLQEKLRVCHKVALAITKRLSDFRAWLED